VVAAQAVVAEAMTDAVTETRPGAVNATQAQLAALAARRGPESAV